MKTAGTPDRNASAKGRVRIALLAVAAAALTATSTPAFAGGGHWGGGRHWDRGFYGGHGFYGPRYHAPRYYGHGYYGGGRHWRHHRGRGGLSGGEAALIGLGIVGGAILIDRALDDRRDRDRFYGDRHYDDRRYRDRNYDDRRFDDRRRSGAFDDDYYYQRDSRPYESDDDIRSARRSDLGRDDFARDEAFAVADPDLLGGDRLSGSASRVAVNAAFRECVAETRGAAGAGGMQVAMPGAPTDVQALADGSVRMVAQFRASNARGEEWTRRFVCEADEQGVRFLQVEKAPPGC
jgi:hypothetical protein